MMPNDSSREPKNDLGYSEKFTLEITLASNTMRYRGDVAEALRKVSKYLKETLDTERNILDGSGNTVGWWRWPGKKETNTSPDTERPGFVQAMECPSCGHQKCRDECGCNCDAMKFRDKYTRLLNEHNTLRRILEQVLQSLKQIP